MGTGRAIGRIPIDCWIPMDDSVELAATIYLPSPLILVPCLLEALPYRKDDVTSSYAPEYERLRHEFGYAVCRLDLRGTDSSGGLALDFALAWADQTVRTETEVVYAADEQATTIDITLAAFDGDECVGRHSWQPHHPRLVG